RALDQKARMTEEGERDRLLRAGGSKAQRPARDHPGARRLRRRRDQQSNRGGTDEYQEPLDPLPSPPRGVREKRPSPPFRGEREGPGRVSAREGEVGSAAHHAICPPHPALSP